METLNTTTETETTSLFREEDEAVAAPCGPRRDQLNEESPDILWIDPDAWRKTMQADFSAEAVRRFREGKSPLRISIALMMRPSQVHAAIRDHLLRLENRGKPLSCPSCGGAMARHATTCRKCWRGGKGTPKGRPLG